VVVLGATPSPKKSLGQHWLNDEVTLNIICDLADLSSTDMVLEIGPGLGSLTKLLVERAGQVTAVEIDSNLSRQLSTFIHADNLTVVNDSILKFDLSKLPVGYKLVANIPYYLTSNLLRLLSESNNPPKLIVLLVQKEVAERVAADAGAMSLLSVTTQYFWEISLELVVPTALFTPPPKVDSQVILLRRRAGQLFPEIDEKSFFRLVKVGFSARRKTLLNSIANGMRIDKEVISAVLEESKIDPNTRPQMLNLNDWYEIYKVCLAKKLI
jgi:16S rRNA (adenine1518-N6/adenine1519-N6)-dimethyltransferase